MLQNRCTEEQFRHPGDALQSKEMSGTRQFIVNLRKQAVKGFRSLWQKKD